MADFGIETFDEWGNLIFSSRVENSNVTLTGFVDITSNEGSFVVDNIPHNKNVFFFPSPNMPLEDASTPMVNFYALYSEDSLKRVIGFAWQYYGWEENIFKPTTENSPVRIYYGYY